MESLLIHAVYYHQDFEISCFLDDMKILLYVNYTYSGIEECGNVVTYWATILPIN